MSSLKSKIQKLPKSPGVYVYYGKKKEVLYVGKAGSLRSRVGSYFSADKRLDLALLRFNLSGAKVEPLKEYARPIEMMIHEVADIKIHKTETVLEALILESQLIKKLQPKYNAMGKDDKSFCYYVITKEEWPRVLILRKTDLKADKRFDPASLRFNLSSANGISKVEPLKREVELQHAEFFGPYISKKQMEIALKILRKIFPFHSNNQKTEKGCLDFQIGRCPGPYAGAISKEDYKKNIRGIRMILEGKKKSLVKKLEKEMQSFAKNNEFEKAAEARNKVFALKHIRDVALMSGEDFKGSALALAKVEPLRIEAYDISHISGEYATGSMVVFKNNEPDKSQYRKFKIKTVEGSDDVGMMKEVLSRRFSHTLTPSPSPSKGEGGRWPMPDLILLDGGVGHLNMSQKLISDLGIVVAVAAVAKGSNRKNLQLTTNNLQLKFKKILYNKNLLKQIMDEAHRFAIAYHRKLRKKNLLS